MRRRQFLQSAVGAGLALSATRYVAAQSQGQTLTPIEALGPDGEKSVLAPGSLQELRDALHGPLLLPQDPGYDDARRVVSRNIDKHPALIVKASGAGDIGTAIAFAREHRLLLAVKCGGHSEYGVSTCDGGMMIDLSSLRYVRVDPGARRAWVAGGSLAGLVDHEAQAHGLVATMGDRGTVGVGGLGTGGGFGYVARRFGLTIDSVRGVDLVTADGRFVHASQLDNPDLFWAVRGGGGNFGVVTNFELELHPMEPHVYSGSVVFPLSQAKQVLRAYADYSAEAPDELHADCFINVVGALEDSTIQVNVCYSGEEGNAERLLAPIQRFAQVRSNTVKRTTYVSAQGADDHPDPRGATAPRAARDSAYLSGLLRGIDASLIADVVTGLHPMSGRVQRMLFQHAGGTIGRVSSTATAFPHRYVTHNMILAMSWPVDAAAAANKSAAHDFWQVLKKHTHGFYNNDLAGEETAEAVVANYGDNYARLVQVKTQYDPQNLFRLNANVVPRTT